MKFKKQFTILLALIMVFSSITNVAAYSWQYGEEIPRSVKIKEAESNKDYKEETVKYVFTIGLNTYQKVSGSNVETRQIDAAPYIKNGRTMLPLRYVSDAISASVYWNNQTRTASFTKESLEAKIQIDGNKIVMSNGTIHTMDAKPDNVKGRILVPITNVASVYSLTNGNSTDGVDNDIEWDGTNRTVTIYLKKYNYVGKKTSEITSSTTSSPARRNNGYDRDYRRSSRYRYDDYSRRYDEYDYWNTYWNIYWRDFCNHNCNPNNSCTNECNCKDNCGKNCKCNKEEIRTDAEKYPVVKPEKVEVENKTALTPEEKANVEAEIKKVNPEAKTIEVKDNGDAVITYPDNSTNTINGEDIIIEKAKTDADKYNITTNPLIKSIGEAITEEEIISRVITDYPKDAKKQPKVNVKDPETLPSSETEETVSVVVIIEYPDGSKEEAEVEVRIGNFTDAEKNPIVKPEKVEVEDRAELTPEEKAKVKEEIKKANPKTEDIEVKENGDAILIYPDGSTNRIHGSDTVLEKSKTDAEKNHVFNPVITEVEDKKHLTSEEKAKVEEEVKKVNPEAETVTVANDGTATLTYQDGSTNKIPGEKTVSGKEKTDAEKYNVTVEPLIKNVGEAVSEEEVMAKVKTDYPSDNEKQPKISVKDPAILPNGETEGTTTVIVVVKYPDDSKEEVEVNVVIGSLPADKTDAEKYPVVKPEKVEVENKTALTPEEKAKVEEEIKKTNPEAKAVEVKDHGNAIIIYPDDSTNTISEEDTITERVKTNAEKYNVTTNPLMKNIGEAITEDEITSKVKIDYPQDTEEQPKISIKDHGTIPNTDTELTTSIEVIIEYPDGSKEEAEVEVRIGNFTDAEKYPVVKPEKTEVEDRAELTPVEKAKVEEKIKKVNPEAKTIEVKDNGDAILTYQDDSTNKISGNDTVVEKISTDAEKNPAMDPAITEVKNKAALTLEEKTKVEEEVKKANPEAETVTVADDGTATLTYQDGSTNEIAGDKTVSGKEKTEAETYDVTTNPINKKYSEAVTEEEIKNNVKTNYPEDAAKLPIISIKDSAELPDGKTEGTIPVVVVITYPDSSKEEATVEVIIGKQADADKYEVEVQEQNIIQDAKVKVENSIKNKDILPEDTKFEFVDEDGNINVLDTSNCEIINNDIKVTYPDGTSEIVKAIIKVVSKDTIIIVEDANKEINEGYTRIILVEDETVEFKDGVARIYDVKSDADIKYSDIVNLVEAMPKAGYKNLNWYELNVVANLFKQINGTDTITLTAIAEKITTTNVIKSNSQKLSIL